MDKDGMGWQGDELNEVIEVLEEKRFRTFDDDVDGIWVEWELILFLFLLMLKLLLREIPICFR